ncbi:MAG TPA: hypothetical protein VEN79_16715 [Terriglobia bacterium]|nr:hypothetical protein [Terriglobia bacterium]
MSAHQDFKKMGSVHITALFLHLIQLSKLHLCHAAGLFRSHSTDHEIGSRLT